MKRAKYKPLSEGQIKVLETNRCRSSDWSLVQVSEGFDPSRVYDVSFGSDVTIGKLNSEDARIVRVSLSHVCIGDNVIIENVGSIGCSEESTFGNGEQLDVMNEGGGRELKMTDITSAQIAYLSVLYRDKTALVARLHGLADKYSNSVRGKVARIGDCATIRNCGEIINVCVGPYAALNGVASLKDGTIVSSREAPTKVGPGVIAEKFILQQGASVVDGAMLSHALVGEGTKIGKQFSAENVAFFANSEGFHSEACAVFGGPYTVTHHRSTLLIAAMYSFYNAGSGTNESNHMYKLGPVHQGIMERGCKTGSFSYMLWPSRVGAFTAVIGKHYANFDTSDFPFSYIEESGGNSFLVPGMNFFTVGTLRDGEKWPARDRRKNARKLDQIIFDVLSPYTGQKMIRGEATLLDLVNTTDRSVDVVLVNGINIKRLLLKTCARYYRLAIQKYLGDVVVSRLERDKPASIREILEINADGEDGGNEWIDMSGLLCTKSRAARLIADIESGALDSLEAVQGQLETICGCYKADEWNWLVTNYEKVNGRPLAEESNDNLVAFLDAWKTASHKLLNMVLGDAEKEFEGAVKTGFGIDGNADADFEAVRGTIAGNKFVNKLKGDIANIEKRHKAAVALVR
jgi:hypothetical protein